MPISRRKSFKYKANKVSKNYKTNRTELSSVARAFAVGALTAMRGDYASQRALATHMGRAQSTLSELLSRTEEKAALKTVALWDEILYENDLGRGRSKLLTQDQKNRIINLVTSSRTNREKESWQAIADGDFDEIVPRMSITTFENVMYEAGYARRRPGWKPHLTPEQEKERYAWALEHNPDKDIEYDNQGFNFYEIAFTDETPARIGEERGMQRTWCKGYERWDDNVKHDRNRKDCCLQFYGAFRYNHKGPCCVYYEETEEEKLAAEAHIKRLNEDTKVRDNKLQIQAREALSLAGESDINKRYNTRKLQYVPSKMDYKRGERSRGGVDGYRHREGALKKVVPWINSLNKRGIRTILLQDGAPAHKSRIARDYLIIQQVERLWWPGHSPEINASEHAWPWIRRHVTKDFTPSCNAKECEKQWVKEWEAMPIEVINRWVDAIPEQVRRIIRAGGKNNFHG
jgi:transposase